MPITGKTRAKIVNDLLSDWTLRMFSAGFGSFNAFQSAWCVQLATALALDLEAFESNAEAIATEIVPSEQTSDTTLARHVAVDGITLSTGTAGTYTVTITGASGTGSPGTVISLVNRRLVSTAGRTYSPVASTIIMPTGATSVAVTIVSDDTGTAPNLAVGAVLTWTAAPLGIDPTATVASIVSAGTDGPTSAQIASAVRDWRRSRPASGNPAYWAQKAEQLSYVGKAFVYPCLKPDLGAVVASDLDVLGTTSLVLIGPPQGDSPTQTQLIGGVAGAQIASAYLYFQGRADLEGNSVYGQPILTPGTQDDGDWNVETPKTLDLAVQLSLTLDGSHAYPFSGTMAVSGTSTTILLFVTGNYTAYTGARALVFVGTSAIRGGYQLVVLPAGTYDAGTNKTKWDLTQTPLLGAPSGNVYPAPGCWEELRLAIFDLFDNLGPGDVADTSIYPAPSPTVAYRRVRFPPVWWESPAVLYTAKLRAVALGVTGVQDCTVVLPASDQTPNAKQLIRLTTFLST